MSMAPADYNALISIVIPVYNGERFINQCIDSVIAQTYKNFEVIIIDDGSCDETPHLLLQYEGRDARIRVVTVANGGQGRARNIGITEAVGEYLFFLDADDTLERTCLQTCMQRIQKDCSDYVAFSFKYIKGDSLVFTNVESYFGDRILSDREKINLLLDCKAYFSVTRLYNAAFIKSNHIHFAEGHIYEDNKFIVETVLLARKVSVVYSPLYNVRLNNESSTKTNTDSRKHCDDYLSAVKECVDCLLDHERDEGAQYAMYYYARYATRRYLSYYYKRVPRQYRQYFASHFVEQMGRLGSLSVMLKNDKLLLYCMDHQVFARRKTRIFRMLTHYMVKTRKAKKSISGHFIEWSSRSGDKPTMACKAVADKANIENGTILFMGCNHDYSGNSRYLFELMMRLPQKGARCVFATESELVDETNRIVPDSNEFLFEFKRASVVIFEGWIPEKYQKNTGQYWIQLWYGMPLQRMLFDTDEHAAFVEDSSIKLKRFADIQRWDYLIAGNEIAARSFETAFLLPPMKIIPACFPSVRFFAENKNNEALKDQLRSKFGLRENEQVVLYVAAWREYNNGKDDSDLDLSYLLDCEELQKKLGPDFRIMAKEQAYMRERENETGLFIDRETQELLLVSDVVITDYCSVMFDAMAIDKPVVLYVNDFEAFDDSRGVYEHMWQHLENLVVDNVADLANVVREMGDAGANAATRDSFMHDLAMEHGLEHLALRLALGKAMLPKVMIIIDESSDVETMLHNMLNKVSYGFRASDFLFVAMGNVQTEEREGGLDRFAPQECYGVVIVRNEADLKSLEDQLVPLMMVFTSDDILQAYERMYPKATRDVYLFR